MPVVIKDIWKIRIWQAEKAALVTIELVKNKIKNQI